MDAADAAHRAGAGVDVPPFEATDMLECSLCEAPCFEYERFFMESSHGFKWGRRCPRPRCEYALCYMCVLRLPAPDFACPACRYSLAAVVGIPTELREWRSTRDRMDMELNANYDAIYSQLRDIQRYFLQPMHDDGNDSDSTDETVT